MGNLFEPNRNRKIVIANRNCFSAPILHPSRILDEHIISYVISGSWELSVGNEVIRAEKDCVFIQPANIPHRGLSLCEPDTETMFVHFSRCPKDCYTEKQPPAPADDCLYLGTLIDASGDPAIRECLIRTIEEQTKGNRIKAAGYLNLLLCELAEGSTSENEYAVRIRQMIDRNINRSIGNREIADALNISVRTAETNFRSFYHISIHAYMLQKKIEQARFYLEYYPNLKIVKIAQDLGFYDEYHFSRQFKKETGLSPSEYRKFVTVSKNRP